MKHLITILVVATSLLANDLMGDMGNFLTQPFMVIVFGLGLLQFVAWFIKKRDHVNKLFNTISKYQAFEKDDELTELYVQKYTDDMNAKGHILEFDMLLKWLISSDKAENINYDLALALSKKLNYAQPAWLKK